MTRSLAFGLWLSLMGGHATVALGVDATGIKIGERWSVVGVIAAGGGKSVAVLRHNPSQKTYTLSIGDALPSESGFVLLAVRGRAVTVAKGSDAVLLAFAESPAEEPAEPVSRTTRFLDAYYRGLRENPDDLPFDPDMGMAEPGVATQLRRFPSFEDTRSRFELYREGKSFRLGDVESAGGPTVNYDNFDEEAADDSDGEPPGPAAYAEPSALPPLAAPLAKHHAKTGISATEPTGSEGLDESTPTE